MTNKEKSGQEKLMEAIRMSEVSCWEKFPRVDGDIHYSEEYLRDMEKLIKKSRNLIRKYFDTVGKRVAAAVIAAVALSGSMMSVSAVREPVVEFITNVYEKFVEIFFGEDDITKAPESIESVYTLGFIPDGYAIDQFIIDDIMVDMAWKNENGDRLVLSQGVLTGSNILDTEESNCGIIERNGRIIAYSEKYGIRSFFWNSAEYEFSLTVSSNISEDEVFALIDSLKKYNQ